MYHTGHMFKLIKKSNELTQSLVLAFVLLFSVGQSLAFYKSCEMNSSDHSVHQNQQADHMSMNVHSTSHPSMADSESSIPSMEDDCCQNNCICPQNACSSISLISIASNKLFLDSNSQSELLAQNNISLDNFSSSLYRPPIA